MGVKKSGKKKSNPGTLPFLIMLIFMIGIPVLAIREGTKPRSVSSAPVETQVYDETDYSGETTRYSDEVIPLTQDSAYSQDSSAYAQNLYGYTGGGSYDQTYTKDRKGLYELTGPVMDTAHVLTASQYAELDSFLMNLDKTTGVQIAVLTVESLEGDSIESYSIKHAEKWKLGQKGVDNGALLTVAMAEHDVRIETGYGTEATLTDAKCSRIIRNIIVPQFRAGNYGNGIIEAVNNMAGIITSDETLVSKNLDSDGDDDELPLPVVIFLLIFGAIYLWGIIRAIRRGGVSGSSSGYHSSGSFHSSSFSSGGGGFSGGGGGFGGGGSSGHW